MSFFRSPSPVFPPFPSLRWCGLLTIFRLPLVSNTGSVIWVREWGRAGWLLLGSHGALFSWTIIFFSLGPVKVGYSRFWGPSQGQVLVWNFPYRPVGFCRNCGVLIFLAVWQRFIWRIWKCVEGLPTCWNGVNVPSVWNSRKMQISAICICSFKKRNNCNYF